MKLLILIGCILISRNPAYTQSSVTDTETQVIVQLIEELSESDLIANYYAGKKLVKAGSKAVPELVKALNHKKGKVRLAAIFLLEQIKDERAIPSLIDVVLEEKRKDNERAAAALALGRMGAKEASDVLIKSFSDSSNTLKSACIMSLGMLKEEKAIPYLIKFTRDKDEQIRKLSVQALRSMNEKAICELEKIIEKGNFDEKLLGIETLGAISSTESIELLKKFIANDDKYIAISSAYVLSTVGKSEGKETAIRMKDDRDPKIRALAIETLKNIEKLEGGNK